MKYANLLLVSVLGAMLHTGITSRAADPLVETCVAEAQKQRDIRLFQLKRSRPVDRRALLALEKQLNPPFISAEVGSVGVLAGGKILQRLDPTTALVFIDACEVFERGPGVPLPHLSKKRVLVIIQGCNFSEFVDGDSFVTDKIFAVVGTQTYSTANGASNTAYQLQPVEDDVKLAILKRLSEASNKKK